MLIFYSLVILALLAEKRKDYPAAMDGYTACLNSSNALTQPQASNSLPHPREMDKNQKLIFMKEIRGEVMLRIALLKKETGYIEQAMQMCNTITSDTFSESIRANALCLKVFKKNKNNFFFLILHFVI